MHLTASLAQQEHTPTGQVLQNACPALPGHTPTALGLCNAWNVLLELPLMKAVHPDVQAVLQEHMPTARGR